MLAVLVLSLVVWYVTRDTLPPTIRLAAGRRGGLYDKFARALAVRLEKRTGRPVRVIETNGAMENRQLLRAGKADLALMQTGAEPLEDLVAVAPVYDELVHVIVRRGRSFGSLSDLRGKSLIIGSVGSGTQQDALRVLEHYQIGQANSQPAPVDFPDLRTDDALDAALATTGFFNPDLCELLQNGQFEILPILDTEALTVRYPFYSAGTIPRGLYAEQTRDHPAVPATTIPTIAVQAFLAARKDTSDALVTRSLAALYEEDLRGAFPNFLPLEQAKTWSDAPRHPAAARYFDPFGGLDLLSSFLQSIAAAKELLLALGAALYLLWDRWNRLREKEQKQLVREQKERLDFFLKETMRVEQAQMDSEDPVALKQYLDEVTCIKLRAMDELTHEDLRDNQMFFIFLMQCSGLISKIQDKIMLHTLTARPPNGQNGWTQEFQGDGLAGLSQTATVTPPATRTKETQHL